MELLEESPDSEVLDGPVKPGAIRVVVADSQPIFRVGIQTLSKTILALLAEIDRSRIFGMRHRGERECEQGDGRGTVIHLRILCRRREIASAGT